MFGLQLRVVSAWLSSTILMKFQKIFFKEKNKIFVDIKLSQEAQCDHLIKSVVKIILDISPN